MEIVSLRSEESKTFSVSPGQFVLQSGGGISHYRDADGWQDIDLTPETSPTPGWTHYFSRHHWRLLVDTNGGRVLILPDRSDDTKWIMFRAHPTLSVPVQLETLGSKAVRLYRNTTNERYNFLISDRGIKPYLVLKNSSSVTQWQLGFKLNNLQRVGRKILDGTKTLGTLPDSWLEDANGVKRDVTETINGDTATLTWDVSGLTYPVTIDPTLSIQPSSTDTSLFGDIPTTNVGTQQYLHTGWVASLRRNCILSLDFTALPSGAKIKTSTFSLYKIDTEGTTDPVGQNFNVYRSTRTDWVETQATFNIYKTSNNWTTPGGDYTTTGGATGTYPANGAWADINVLTQTQYWQTNGKIAHFIARDSRASYTGNTEARWASNNNATAANRPKLTIYYSRPGSGWKGDISWVW